MHKSSNKQILINKLILLASIALTIVLLLYYFNVKQYLSMEGFHKYQYLLNNYATNNHTKFIIFYSMIYIICITLCIPGTIFFDLLAGVLFGVFAGSVLVVFNYLIGSILNFIFIRLFTPNFFHNKFLKFRKLIIGDGKHSLLLNLIGLRIIGIIPFWIINILSSILKVRLSTFILSTAIGIIPTSIVYVVLGAGLGESLTANYSTDMLFNAKIWIALFFIAVIIVSPNVIAMIKKHRKLKNHPQNNKL